MHAYEEYCSNMRAAYSSSRYRIHRCLEHQGFAHAVKSGLELCTTEYALIAQHDRNFRITFPFSNLLLDAMDKHTNIRYIGFPSNANINHDLLMKTEYNLDVLTREYSHELLASIPEDSKVASEPLLKLQPLIFWYDSQHLCHVQRYLEIFRPFKNLPNHLKDEIGLSNVRRMLLKKGDFIEDKFGQMQHRLLTGMVKVNKELTCELFQWYGCYLCWWTGDSTEVIQNGDSGLFIQIDGKNY